MRTSSASTRERADSLKLVAAVCVFFWGSFLLPDRTFDVLDQFPLAYAVWWALWVTAAPATLFAVPFVMRDLKQHRPWWQVILAILLAASIWAQMSRVHL